MNGPIGELLKTPDFLRLWLVGAFANAMRWLELLASGLFAYEVTGSAMAATAVGAGRQLPQVLLTPHVAAVSPSRFWERELALFEENWRRYDAGLTMLNEVDKRAGY